jgi:hypothetical protein
MKMRSSPSFKGQQCEKFLLGRLYSIFDVIWVWYCSSLRESPTVQFTHFFRVKLCASFLLTLGSHSSRIFFLRETVCSHISTHFCVCEEVCVSVLYSTFRAWPQHAMHTEKTIEKQSAQTIGNQYGEFHSAVRN